MLKRLQNLRAYVRAAANPGARFSAEESKDTRAEQLLRAALSWLILLLLLFSVGAVMEGRVSAVGFVILGLVLAGMLGLYVPLNRGYVSSAASALVTLLVLGTTAFLASQGTMRGPGVDQCGRRPDFLHFTSAVVSASVTVLIRGLPSAESEPTG